MKPLLSICIPTYNHAELLKLLLVSLVPQVNKLNGSVEIVVSDNCSTDHTAEIVGAYHNNSNVHYHRNAYNRGGNANLVFAPKEWAKGEYCWIIGDDDMIIQGQLARIVTVLNENPTIDAFYTNIAFELVTERNKIIVEKNSEFEPKPGQCISGEWLDKSLARWEDLLAIMDNKADMLTAVVGHIFRRSVWCDHVEVLGYDMANMMSIDKEFSSLAYTYPHVKILAAAMVGKPSFFIGRPAILMGQSFGVHYVDSVPVIDLFRRNDLFDFLTQMGISSELLAPYREHWLRMFGSNVMKLLLSNKVDSTQFVSLEEFGRLLQRFGGSAVAWQSVMQEFMRIYARRFANYRK